MDFFSINTTYPLWLIIPAIILAAAMAWWFYSDKKVLSQISATKRYILTSLRFIALLAIMLLLLGIILKTITNEIKKPVIVLAHDNSKSIVSNRDSVFYKSTFTNNLTNLKAQLLERYDVREIQFAGTISEKGTPDYSGESTNLSQVFKWVETNLYGENIGAIVVASDGIINQGTNVNSLSANIQYPVYTIALGDTTPQSDLMIAKVEYNKTAYTETLFPIVASIKANDIKPRTFKVNLSKNNEIIESKEIAVNSSRFFQKVSFYLKEQSAGIVKYTLNIEHPDEDANKANNTFPVFINIKSERIKILYLQESWHPDAAAFQQVLKNDQRYELPIRNAAGFTEDVSDYSLIILHQLPSSRNNIASLLKTASEKEIALLFIIGDKTNLAALNQLRAGIEIRQNRIVFDDVMARLNPNFPLFEPHIDPMLAAGLPPLRVPFGDYREVPESQVLFYQQIGSVTTTKPLVFFSQTASQKTGFICGEGIWRWRLAEFAREGNQTATNQIIAQIVQYLSNREKKDRFVIEVPDLNTDGNEVNFNGLLYNKAYQPVNTSEVKMTITDENGKQFQYLFQPVSLGYTLNAGQLAQGNYHYLASTELGDEQLTREGSFFVAQANLEEAQLEANHNLLYQLAVNNNGHMFLPQQIDSLPHYLENNSQISAITRSHTTTNDLINLKWFLFILILALSAEWFLRKYWGLI